MPVVSVILAKLANVMRNNVEVHAGGVLVADVVGKGWPGTVGPRATCWVGWLANGGHRDRELASVSFRTVSTVTSGRIRRSPRMMRRSVRRTAARSAGTRGRAETALVGGDGLDREARGLDRGDGWTDGGLCRPPSWPPLQRRCWAQKMIRLTHPDPAP
jgi:hypothetical protein